MSCGTAAVILPSGRPNQTNDEDDGTCFPRNAVASTTTIVFKNVNLHANSAATAMNATAAKMDVIAWRQEEGPRDKTAIVMLLLRRRTAMTQVPFE